MVRLNKNLVDAWQLGETEPESAMPFLSMRLSLDAVINMATLLVASQRVNICSYAYSRPLTTGHAVA